jgi:hypothetical protein
VPLHEHDEREQRNPAEAHRAERHHQRHQEEAAAGAVDGVENAAGKRRLEDQPERRAAAAQARILERRELVGSRCEKHRACPGRADGRSKRRERREAHDAQRNPGGDIAEQEGRRPDGSAGHTYESRGRERCGHHPGAHHQGPCSEEHAHGA